MAAHRLVALGDSLTHGFQSFAIYNTDRSYPKLIAECLGLSDDEFRVPSYRPASGQPDYMGPALNLEYMARAAGEGDCTEKSLLEQMEIGVKALKNAVAIRIHWDDRARIDELKIDPLPADGDIVHNLSVAGFDVGDLMARTADTDIATLHQWAEFTDLGLVATNAGLEDRPAQGQIAHRGASRSGTRRGRRYRELDRVHWRQQRARHSDIHGYPAKRARV